MAPLAGFAAAAGAAAAGAVVAAAAGAVAAAGLVGSAGFGAGVAVGAAAEQAASSAAAPAAPAERTNRLRESGVEGIVEVPPSVLRVCSIIARLRDRKQLGRRRPAAWLGLCARTGSGRPWLARSGAPSRWSRSRAVGG